MILQKKSRFFVLFLIGFIKFFDKKKLRFKNVTFIHISKIMQFGN